MKKRILLMLLCLLMVLSAMSLMTACTPDGEGDGDTTADPNAKIEIELGIWPEDPTDIETFEVYKAKFEDQYPNVTVTPAAYKYAVDTFIPMASAGTLPTIFDCWYTEPVKLISAGYLKDITDELDAKGWTDKIADGVKDILSDDAGRIYGVPRDSYGLGVLLNLAMFKEAGLVADDGTIDYPKTLDEMAETAKKIKDATGKAGMVILSNSNTGGWHFTNIAWNFGATLQTQDGDNWVANLNSAEAVEAMKWIYSLKWNYDVLPADVLQDWGTGHKLIGTGEAAMYFAAADGVGVAPRDYGLSKDDMALIPFPEGPGGQYSLMGGTFYGFANNATPEQVTACLNFLEIYGKAPVITDDAIQGMKDTWGALVTDGVPVLPAVSAWKDEEYNNKVDEIREEFVNIDFEKNFKPYYDVTADIVRPEEPNDAQSLYAAIDPVVQEVLSNKDCDIQKLLDKANEEYQKVLDESFNNA